MNLMGKEESIDVDRGLRYYGGDKEIFYQNLTAFDTMTLNDGIQSIHRSWKATDFESCNKTALKLKGGAG